MTEWKEVKLGDLFDVKHGYAFSGSGITDVPTENILVTPGNFHIGGGFKSTKLKYFRSEFPTEYVLKEGDIVITMTDLSKETDTLGYSAKIPKHKEIKFLHNQRIGLVQFKSDTISKDFIYWLLRTREYQGYIIGSASGTSIMHTSPARIKDYSFLLPALPEQKAIATILSSLDDKIDLLHRQNATLEKMAETLFRQWFVEGAKEEWENLKVKDVCLVITKGTTPTTLGKSFKGSGINFIKAESLTDVGTFIPAKFAFIDEDTNDLLKRSQIQTGDVLITIAGTIGRIGYVTKDILPANTNQAIGIMRANHNIINPYFLYCLFNSTEVKIDFDGRIVHAVQPNLSLGQIGDIEFKLPPQDILDFGMQQIEGLFTKKNRNTTQIFTLTALRDTLLPKLMSGEVRVEIN